jgi:8-oxo-dGTP pyrophosphatase MutT (NUDIX family)
VLSLPRIEQHLASHSPTLLPAEVTPRRAAVAMVLREPASRGCCELLVIKRARSEHDPWSGHMAFPGGRLESSDAGPLDAARRETLEEVGLDLARDARLLGRVDDVRATARGRALPMAISPFVFQLVGPVDLRRNEEVDEIHWITLAALLDPKSSSTVPYELGGRRYDLPCFRVNERVIWGLTYQMLVRLFGILELKPGDGEAMRDDG